MKRRTSAGSIRRPVSITSHGSSGVGEATHTLPVRDSAHHTVVGQARQHIAHLHAAGVTQLGPPVFHQRGAGRQPVLPHGPEDSVAEGATNHGGQE